MRLAGPGTDTNCEQGLEAEIEGVCKSAEVLPGLYTIRSLRGLQKALEEGRCREQFAVRRRLHQLQNVARGSTLAAVRCRRSVFDAVPRRPRYYCNIRFGRPEG